MLGWQASSDIRSSPSSCGVRTGRLSWSRTTGRANEMRFIDRTDAGQRLAKRLEHLRDSNVVVLGLPRGGVPVAREVAQALDAPLEVLIVRKVGMPSNPEVAMGAIGEGGFQVFDRSLISAGHVT